jgi:tetratricopeptide (TPR) repeat protein
MALVWTLIFCRPISAQIAKDYYEEGLKFMKAGDHNRAIEAFEKAIQIKSDVSQLYSALGVAYMHQGEPFQNAIDAFEKAISLQPQNVEAHFNLGILYASRVLNPDLAIEYRQKTVALDPSYPRAYLGLGWLYLIEKRDARKAADFFNKSVELSPDLAEGVYGLGTAYVAQGKKELALRPISQLRLLKREDLALIVEEMVQGKRTVYEEAGTTEAEKTQVELLGGGAAL